MTVSVIISTYNSKKFLKHKINNVLKSNIQVEIIIIDCSNDSKNIPKSHNIKIIKIPKRITIWKAINIGIKNSTNEYIVQANTDDLVSPLAYNKQVDKLNEGFDISYFDYYITDGYHYNWETAKQKSFSKYITPTNGYSIGNGLGMFPMWRKSIHEEVGYFDENLEVYGDSLFWEQLVKHKKKFGKIPELLGVYAQRPGENLETRLGHKDKKYLKKMVHRA